MAAIGIPKLLAGPQKSIHYQPLQLFPFPLCPENSHNRRPYLRRVIADKLSQGQGVRTGRAEVVQVLV